MNPAVHTEDGGTAAIGHGQSEHDANGRGLARPVLAEQGEDGAWGDLEGDPAECDFRAEDLDTIVELNDRVHASPSSCSITASS